MSFLGECEKEAGGGSDFCSPRETRGGARGASRRRKSRRRRKSSSSSSRNRWQQALQVRSSAVSRISESVAPETFRCDHRVSRWPWPWARRRGQHCSIRLQHCRPLSCAFSRLQRQQFCAVAWLRGTRAAWVVSSRSGVVPARGCRGACFPACYEVGTRLVRCGGDSSLTGAF